MQKTAFRAYLDAVDMRAAQVCDDATYDERSKVSLQSILQASGVPLEQAEKYATIIQAAFRGHYERMQLNESRGMIQWQRAATRTLEILRKAGASQAEASKAAILIQATYRGYYTRRNLKMKMKPVPQEVEDSIEPREAVQAVAWLDTMYEDSELTPMKAASIIQKAYRQYLEKKNGSNCLVESTRPTVPKAMTYEDSGLTSMRANEAASIIQKAYRRYHEKKNGSNRLIESTKSAVPEAMYEELGLTPIRANEAASIIQKAYRRYRRKGNNTNPSVELTKSVVAEAILKNLHQKVFDEVLARADIPTEFGNREDLTKAGEELQRAFKDRLMRARMAEEGYDEGHVEELGESFQKMVNSIGVAEDWQEDREIEVEPERDDEIDAYVQD
ncbi:PREDICTED: abnormal spindle-like microcephaly-associated protein homolog isoform X3 [Wasmannia auropunctata]|uniref:abnormal spindle-like microcephaly-associated protein homolog isoform X3 n=1 Tax=Wasmannia auropunctata TaxID=64793 RepID=UPI0005EEA74F|nr:PREDICTED: abnormal spindle-like microcephaly-associated protein homolog isoform X3 [Wasmannia auropunctata]